MFSFEQIALFFTTPLSIYIAVFINGLATPKNYTYVETPFYAIGHGVTVGVVLCALSYWVMYVNEMTANDFYTSHALAAVANIYAIFIDPKNQKINDPDADHGANPPAVKRKNNWRDITEHSDLDVVEYS